MASKLALRTLGAIALPGAFLAVAAPGASASELTSPLSQVQSSSDQDTQDAQGTDTAGSTSMLPETSGLMSGETFSF